MVILGCDECTLRDLAGEVKREILDSAGFFSYPIGMASPDPETLDDLIADARIPLGVLAERAQLDPWTIVRLRRGAHSPQVATLDKLARALKVKPARLRRAIAAQRATASF